MKADMKEVKQELQLLANHAAEAAERAENSALRMAKTVAEAIESAKYHRKMAAEYAALVAAQPE